MASKKKVPAVVLDVDDTIVDFIGHLCYLYNAKNGTSVTGGDLTSWDFVGTKVEDAQGKIVRGSALRKFFVDYEDSGLYAACPVIKESAMALELMRKYGYKIIFLTARPERFRKDTEINMLVNRVPFDDLIFDKDKPKQIKRLARNHTIHVFADDNIEHVKGVENTDRVETCYLINKPSNREEKIPEEIVRVNDLLEVVRTLPDVADK